ncbi:MAG: flagellar basal body-associated FliL family protein [Pirellulales bacterium]
MSAHKEEAGHAAPKGGGLLSKLVPALIVIAVVSGEGVAAFMLMPSVEENAKHVQEALAAKPPEPHHDEHAVELDEVDLEQFKITSFQPASSITLRIEFHLFGMVPHGKAEEFKTSYESKKNRVRDNVMAIIRSAEMNDLTDPGLGLIKRKILETTNKALGKPLLEGVMFAEFTFLEQ